jgi:crotonobetaine/carnitine-CoA ligase
MAVTSTTAAVPGEEMMRTCVWPLLQRQAAVVPDAPFFECGGERLTFAQVEELVARVATGLRRLGLAPGERMAIFAENSVDALLAWLGANAAGIVDVPINLEARGDYLRYLLDDSAPKAIVASAERLAALAELTPRLPEIAVVLDGKASEVTGYGRVFEFSGLRDTPAADAELDRHASRTRDLATIMYTSGTTGPSKGVMLPHGYYAAFGLLIAEHYEMTASDALFCMQPLFHIDARMAVTAVLCTQARVTLGGKFSARRFWNEIRATGATRWLYIGTMIWILAKQDEDDADGDQPASVGLGSSTPWEIREAFERRFSTTLLEAYGMTEAVLLTCNVLSDRRAGSVGRASRAVEVAVVDEHDEMLGPDHAGEIVFRPRYPNVVTQGYWNKPEATAEAWRNLWFHTGDLGRLDEDGFLYYLGRGKDSIRRRGENVSAWEVEQALTLHPDVLESAVFGVPSPVGEEDVAVLCVVKSGSPTTHEELHAFVSRDLPSFAVPRYIEFVESLPKTPSERIAKGLVRERGVTGAAWDATAH